MLGSLDNINTRTQELTPRILLSILGSLDNIYTRVQELTPCVLLSLLGAIDTLKNNSVTENLTDLKSS